MGRPGPSRRPRPKQAARGSSGRAVRPHPPASGPGRFPVRQPKSGREAAGRLGKGSPRGEQDDQAPAGRGGESAGTSAVPHPRSLRTAPGFARVLGRPIPPPRTRSSPSSRRLFIVQCVHFHRVPLQHHVPPQLQAHRQLVRRHAERHAARSGTSSPAPHRRQVRQRRPHAPFQQAAHLRPRRPVLRAALQRNALLRKARGRCPTRGPAGAQEVPALAAHHRLIDARVGQQQPLHAGSAPPSCRWTAPRSPFSGP